MTKSLRNFPEFEFHISNVSRIKYQIKDELISTTGSLISTNKIEIRKLVQKVNEERDNSSKITAGKINAAGLLDEVYHQVFRYYEKNVNSDLFQNTVNHLKKQMEESHLRSLLIDFLQKFPPKAVYQNEMTAEQYLESVMFERTNIERSLEELILLYFGNFNPSNKLLLEFFDENLLYNFDSYKWTIIRIEKYFESAAPIRDNKDIFTFLKEPILAHPDDVEAQLEYIISNWQGIIDESVINEILKSKDLLKEERIQSGFFGGAAPTLVPDYSGNSDLSTSLGKSGYNFGKDSYKDYEEEEKFTEDIHWMPQVVLLAKNIYVWLDQMSKKYNRIIRRLDQIPDEELDELQQRHFTGLWLIGLWERSNASKEIKNRMGNPDAVASAYSLFDYQIANNLGGELAYENLNTRCKDRGIRLASDMVPNHTGIYSDWVINHPDYFVQNEYSPYPNYQFNSEDLSEDPNIEIKIEDGYYNHSDAAVVFRRVDKRSGDVRYIYHGNDGTNMPWNDTAQLNYMKQEVREAVINKIFDVAKKFSIIRFDAAMTLAKKHYQRLWFPQPGTGGDIPSRSDYSMTREEFDDIFPVEFWREVVDRINNELPETLLLAEAFWLMEGYFVRTLGMHRVYNSAFMNMIMREENSKYKDLIKKTLEFEPEILKRYVNFMSNPDEETAIKQFGTGDKYFGVCTMMITLPGLPMFAHGQVEGYSEKYGMEYQRAYYNELPNVELVDKHKREIFPVTRFRYLFSEVNNFWLYDLYNDFGHVNDNVFAYSNSFKDKKALVFFNNKYDRAEGTINISSKKLTKNGNDKYLSEISAAEALGLKDDINVFYILRDSTSGLEYLFNGHRLHRDGLKVNLQGFEYRVYMDVREVYDTYGDYERFSRRIGLNGVPSVDYSIEEMNLEHIIKSFYDIINDSNINGFIKSFITLESNETEDALVISKLNGSSRFLHFNIEQYFNFENNEKEILKNNEIYYKTIGKLNKVLSTDLSLDKKGLRKDKVFKLGVGCNYNENTLDFLIARTLYNIYEMSQETEFLEAEKYIEVLHLDNHIKTILSHTGRADYGISESISLIKLIAELLKDFTKLKTSDFETECCKKEVKCELITATLNRLLKNNEVMKYLHVHEYKGINYFSKENFNEMIDWIFTILAVQFEITLGENEENNIFKCAEVFINSKGLAEKSGYNFEKLLELI